MLTDTHCHIFKQDYENVDEVFKNLKNKNIKRIILNGFNLESNKELLEYIDKYENVYGALGITPDYTETATIEDINFIKENLKNRKIIAIGEIGLDYHYDNPNKEKQLECMEMFLNIAENNNLPVIIHNRQSTDDMLRILKKHNVKGIIHCFSGSIETAREFVKLGFLLGIGGVLTFKNSKLSEVVKEIGIDNILLETDSPYLSPEPLRGTKNEPSNVNYVFNYLCNLFEISSEELSTKLEENFNKVFSIK